MSGAIFGLCPLPHEEVSLTGVAPLPEVDIDFVEGVAKVNDPSRYGVVAFNEDETINRIVEKPTEPISEWALIGVYVFNDNVFDAVKQIKPA